MMTIATVVETFFAALMNAEGHGATDAPPLIVGVSGGPDSLALLHVLARRGAYPQDMIVVAHLNHMLRPSAADEASYVQSLATDWRLQFRSRAVDVRRLAETGKSSLETAARQARYEFLADVAREWGTDLIATGHNQNDQAETVLMHLVRGSGLTGLRGMQPVSPLPLNPEMKLLRPLLGISRAIIESYCDEHDLPYVVDETNQDVSLLRNRLRHELLPILAALNPQIIDRLDSLSRVVDADEALLAAILDEQWPDLVVDESRGQITLKLEQWRALPLAMRRRTLRRAARLLLPPENDIGFEVTELARDVAEHGESGDRAMLPGGVELIVEYGRLMVKSPNLQHDSGAWPQLADDEVRHLVVPGLLQLSGEWRIVTERVRVSDFDQIAHNEDPWRAYINVAFADELVVRPRRAGERFRPLGMGGKSNKIGDIMTDRKVPKRYRVLWPLLTSLEHGLWLPGHVVDHRARVKPGDSEAILVKVQHPTLFQDS